MGDNYNIDDILLEVKKRREENEKRIISGKEPETEVPEKIQVEIPIEVSKETSTEIPEELPAEEPQIEPEVPQDMPKEDYSELKLVGEDPIEQSNEEIHLSFQEKDISRTADVPEEVRIQANRAENAEMIDILQITQEEKPLQKKKADRTVNNDTKTAKRGKIIKGILIAMIVLVIGAIVFGVLYANNALNTITGTNGTTTESKWSGMDVLEETFEPFSEVEADELSSLQDMIKTWYYTGTPVKSTHVLNVLLIGEDTRGDEILEEGTRADSAIIASINIDTKQINLTSILRDTYTYWENTPGDESTGQFGKINAAMSLGDVDAYINCVERMYKIDIDNYVIVNFDSFESIVDTMGGVELELTEREINEINNHPKRYNKTTIEKTFEGSKGTMKVNGKQALAYCRIRKLDSDNMRANRQKICLTQIFNQARDVSAGKLIKIVNSLIPYVKTGYNKSSVVKIAKYALTNNWMKFDIVTNNIPDSRINERGAGGVFYGSWCWKSDFPQDAYNLQMRLYEKSNITLAMERVDVLKCGLKGFRSEGASKVYPTITNNAYGMLTTTTNEPSQDSKSDSR